MRVLYVYTALVLLIGVIGCGGEGGSGDVLIRVGETAITLEEFQRAWDEAVGHGDVYQADSLSARRFLNDYINKTLLEQIAADSLEWDPLLEHRAVSYLETLMVHKMREDAYGHAGRISPEELREVWESKGKEAYHYQAIPFQTQKDALDKLLQIREGAQFTMMADHLLGRGDGGDMGWATILEVPEQVIDLLASLSPGEVGGPVEAGGVYYLIRLVESSANPDQRPFEEVEQGFRIKLVRDRGGALVRSFQRELLEKYRYEPRMAEILWMLEFLYEETKDIDRNWKPKLTDQMVSGMPVTDPSSAPQVPWTSNPFTEEESQRILSVTTVDTVSAILFLDHVLSKPVFSWPTFEKPDDVNNLLRELVISRLERFEAWERGYDQDPDLAWQGLKRRNLILTRQFFRRHVYPLVRPTVEEARAWWEANVASQELAEERKYVLLLVRDWPTALKARETLSAGLPPAETLARVQQIDPDAALVGRDGYNVARGRIANQLETQLFRLTPGDVTEPVPMGERFAVARLEEVIALAGTAWEDVADQVMTDLEMARGDSLLNVYITERRELAKPTWDEKVFRRLRLDGGTPQ